jgi:hypothetical protein
MHPTKVPALLVLTVCCHLIIPLFHLQGEFFQPTKFVRSTSVGATNLGISLATGTLVVGPATAFVAQWREQNPTLKAIVYLWAAHQVKWCCVCVCSCVFVCVCV